MGFYDRKLKRLDINLKKMYEISNSRSVNSRVYRHNDIAIKSYGALTFKTIDEEMFDKLAAIKNKHFIELYDLFTYIDDDEYYERLYAYNCGRNTFVIDGYTSKYYQKDYINPLHMDSSYLLRNIEEIKELIDTFSKNNILVNDFELYNTVINKDNIVIIDPDLYMFSITGEEITRKNNYLALFALLESIFEGYYIGSKNYVKSLFKKLEAIDPIDSVEEVERSLKKVRNPLYLIK